MGGIGKWGYAIHRRLFGVLRSGLCAGGLFRGLLFSALASGNGWRNYEVYQSGIERGYVIESTPQGLAYNHCPTVMWFRDRWFCAWNGNEIPVEGRPGLQIWMSTSRDGTTWSDPFAPFSSEACCENPFRHPKATQWQPEFIVIDGQLWCFFYEGSPNQDEKGCYFARLSTPDDKWRIRPLSFNGERSLKLDGHEFGMIFPSQNPIQLRSGRILVPVVLCGGRSPDAPEKAKGFWGVYRHASVLYSDDLGETWTASPGCTLPGRTFCPWEPTVWEQADGSVRMFFRNNCNAAYFDEMPRSSQFLIGSFSRDGGRTWATPEYVPIETVCSRMYVAPLDGKGIWEPVAASDDFNGRLQLMLHNDVPGSRDWAGDRRNLALFFKRGDGIEFTAGPGFSGTEPRAVYPQYSVHDRTLLVTYCQSFLEKRSIRYARISPLPDPAKRYLLPRFDTAPSQRPERRKTFLSFDGKQFVAARNVPGSGTRRLALSAWIRWRTGGVILSFPDRDLSLRVACGTDGIPYLFFRSGLHTPAQVKTASPIPQDQWVYVGFDLNAENGQGVFYVDGKCETVKLAPKPKRKMAAGDVMIGWQTGRPATYGDIRWLALFDQPLGMAGHRTLHDRFAAELGQSVWGEGSAITAKTLLAFDPAASDFSQVFQMPDCGFQGVRTALEDGRKVMRFFGEGSAGVDLDENHRGRGDAVELRFRFKIESGDGHVICTVGDADQPARVTVGKGRLFVSANGRQSLCGNVLTNTWNSLDVATGTNETRVRLNGLSWGDVTHTPRGTWVYLGQGYQTGVSTCGNRFLIDCGSVQTRVLHSAGNP